MLQGFYSAAVGAQQQMDRLNVQANNIANVNTYGYRAEKPAFEALMYGMLDGIGGEQLPRGTGALMISTATDFSDAPIEETGRAQDYAIEGEGFFALYNPGTGEVSYTRDGSFTVTSYQVADEEGNLQEVYYLTDGEGRQVLDTAGYPIVVEDATEEQPVGVFTLQYKDGLQHLGSGRFLAGDKNGSVWVGTSPVLRGYLETANVDLAEELGKVIEAQRSYSLVLKMMTTTDEVETTINNLTNG